MDSAGVRKDQLVSRRSPDLVVARLAVHGTGIDVVEVTPAGLANLGVLLFGTSTHKIWNKEAKQIALGDRPPRAVLSQAARVGAEWHLMDEEDRFTGRHAMFRHRSVTFGRKSEVWRGVILKQRWLVG